VYFEKMTKLNYDFPSVSTMEMQDIFRRVVFTESTKNNQGNFETYIVKEGQRPEDVAEDFYGNPEWWWLVLMCNDIIDVESEWTKSTHEVNSLFSNYLSGFSYFVFEDLDILPNDIMVKRWIGEQGATEGITTDHYGVISSYDRLLHKIDVKQYAGSIEEGEDVYIFRESSINSGDYNLISGFGSTSCVQPYYGSPSCVVFEGPSAGAGNWPAPLCATAGTTFAKIQKRTSIGNSVVEFEYQSDPINPYSGVIGNGISGDFLKYQNICGMTGTVIYRYINGTLTTDVKAVTVREKAIINNDKNRTIKLLSPSLAAKLSIEMGVLLKGGVSRGTTNIIE